jgi:hypothetical protein
MVHRRLPGLRIALLACARSSAYGSSAPPCRPYVEKAEDSSRSLNGSRRSSTGLRKIVAQRAVVLLDRRLLHERPAVYGEGVRNTGWLSS